ncbi:hypothetical protein [Geoglobus ahangari]
MNELKRHGVKLFPRMEVEFVVVDFDKKVVSIRGPEAADLEYYARILKKAFEEVEFAVRWVREPYDRKE